jgi:hypothetical protein
MPPIDKSKLPPAGDTDHKWFRKSALWWKCSRCGARTKLPPRKPTPVDWMPEGGYEALTEEERAK